MASQAILFNYSPERVEAIERSLSPDRLTTYLRQAEGDRIEALTLYLRNTTLSESLYGVLQGVEITVRNSMNSVLRDKYDREDWYLTADLLATQRSAIDEALRRLRTHGKPNDPSRVVSELSFGFWTGLTGKRYARTLWVPCLYRAFPRVRLSHRSAHARLDWIRKLRNRVAHHEPIFQRDLARDLSELLETLSWICPITADWVEATNSLKAKVGAGGLKQRSDAD